jgi:hypothetical protein
VSRVASTVAPAFGSCFCFAFGFRSAPAIGWDRFDFCGDKGLQPLVVLPLFADIRAIIRF